jgi:pilus assembly protein CpaB
MKSKLPLMMAVIIGVLALLAVRSYVSKIQERTNAQLKGDLLVAANRDIPRGAEFTLDMLRLKQVPRQSTPNMALKGAEEAKQLVGRKAAFNIQKESIISWSDVEPDKPESLSSSIPEGLRGFTISISKGLKPTMLQPGDHIDILGSFASPKPNQPMPATASTWRQSSDMVNIVLLQNVTVLAVGDSLATPAGGKFDTAGGTDLTLALTLQEAQMLMFASEHGELGAVLRHWESTDTKPRNELPRITFEKVEEMIGDLDSNRTYRIVEIQRGAAVTPVPVPVPK